MHFASLFCVLISLLQHYDFKYRCDDCLYGHTQYKTIYNLDQTSVNVTVLGGERYRVWNRVHTRYGYGTEAQTTALVKFSLGPVTMLKAELDKKVQNLVHLTWDAPAKSSVKVNNNNNIYYYSFKIFRRF